MGVLSILLTVAYTLGIVVWVELVDLRNTPPEGILVTVDVMAPQAWERRYVQTSDVTGQEVLLLKRANENPYWLASTATEGILKVNVNDRKYVRTAIQGPKVGVAYQPIGALGAPARNALMAQADAFSNNGTAGMRILAFQQRGTGVRRYLGMLLTTPASAWRIVRWSMRKPSRAVGLLAMVWMLTEAMQAMGVFDYVKEKVVKMQSAAEHVKESIMDASEYAAEIITILSATYESVSGYVAPWKLPFLGLAVWLAVKWFKEAGEEYARLPTGGNGSRSWSPRGG